MVAISLHKPHHNQDHSVHHHLLLQREACYLSSMQQVGRCNGSKSLFSDDTNVSGRSLSAASISTNDCPQSDQYLPRTFSSAALVSPTICSQKLPHHGALLG